MKLSSHDNQQYQHSQLNKRDKTDNEQQHKYNYNNIDNNESDN